MLLARCVDVFAEDFFFVYGLFCFKEKENFQGGTFFVIQKSKGASALGSISAALSCLVYSCREEQLDA